MIGNFFVNDNFLSIFNHFIHYEVCSNSILTDNVLYLISPKILESHIDKLVVNKNNFISTDNEFVKTDNLNNKFDKKNKNYTKIEDVIDVKKNKSKLGKRSKKTVALEDSQRLIQGNSIILNEDVLNFEVIKTPRPKKKNKLKYDNNSNGSNIEVDNLSELSTVIINKPLSIQNLSIKLKIPAPEIITYLFLKGISVTMNQFVDINIAKDIAANYKVEVLEKEELIEEHYIALQLLILLN